MRCDVCRTETSVKGTPRLSLDQQNAILVVAEANGWDKQPDDKIGLLLWALFHYYVLRLKN